jgi:hypothetical protein
MFIKLLKRSCKALMQYKTWQVLKPARFRKFNLNQNHSQTDLMPGIFGSYPGF